MELLKGMEIVRKTNKQFLFSLMTDFSSFPVELQLCVATCQSVNKSV